MKRAVLIRSQVGGLTGVHRDVAAMDEVLGLWPLLDDDVVPPAVRTVAS